MATKKTAKSAPKKTAAKRPAATKPAKSTVKTAAKKTAKAAVKKTAKKAAPKRELIAPRGDKRYIRRDERGRIVESDDQGRSLSQDIKKAAKKKVPAGQGDRGDQKRKK